MTIRLLLICVIIELLSTTGISKSQRSESNLQAQTQCDAERRTVYYQEFISNSAAKSDQAKALAAANKYLACPAEPVALANLNFAVGRMLRKNYSHEEAIPYFLKAVAFDTKIRTSPETYFYLGEAYEKGLYARLAGVYREKFAGKDESDESRLALANINQVVDCLIDAYARAVVLAGDEWRTLRPRTQGGDIQTSNGEFSQAECFEALTFWYKVRQERSGAGLKELLEKILSQPLPPQPTPLTSLPPREKHGH